jgi:hypothetical protein
MDNGSFLQVDRQVIEQLANTVKLMTRMLERMLQAHEVQDRSLTDFRADLRRIRDTISRIARVLHEGNGERPLTMRVALLEQKLNNLDEDFQRMLKKEVAMREEKKLSRRGKYTLATALISGIAGLATAIISLLSG